MERERFIEMKENLRRLSETGALGTSGVSVFLFAHCGATMELADELHGMGIKPEAILDNNADKYGLDYKGIPVCEPKKAVDSDNAIILIVSRFYEQMASQMRRLGFKGNIEKLIDYNTYAEYSLLPDTLIRKSRRLIRGIEKLARIKSDYQGHLIVLCPFPALGDVYLCMSYLKPFMDVNGYDKCLVCVVGNAQMQTAKLFDYAEIQMFNQNKIDEVIQAVIYTGDPDCYIAHQDRPYVVDLHRALYKKCIPLEMIYKCGVFGLPQDTKPVEPVKWDSFEFPKGSAGSSAMTAIVAPYAKSVALLPKQLWADIIKDLKALGSAVYTNVAGDEKVLDGTEPISPVIAQMKSAVEQADVFIGIRSGMCDVIRTAECKKIVLYPDYYYCDTKWKSIDMYALDGFKNVVVREGDSWEIIKKRIGYEF